jgi:hypothetical protein
MSLLYGLNDEQSLLAVWKLLFSPPLQQRVAPEESLNFCKRLIEHCAKRDAEGFASEFLDIERLVTEASTDTQRPSIDNPPWSIFSIDMRVGIFPWVSPLLDRFLFFLLSNGSITHDYFGRVLPIAFVLSGGPGDTKDSAIRICAPSQGARISAEYWLIRAFLDVREQGAHFTLSPDEYGRQFSLHNYTDIRGNHRSLYFETTESFGQERENFLRFLYAR